MGGGDRNLADRPSPPARPEGARGWSFADTLDLVSECVAVFDAKDILSYCNQRYADLVAGPGAPLPIGASFQQLLRSTLADDFSGAELEMRLKARMSMWRASPNQTIDQERANGRWFRIRENSLPDGRVVLIISDISDLKSQELALRTGESRFRDFTMAASDWFWETDANLRLTFVAEGVLHSLGRPVSDVIGKSLAQFIREGIYAYENPNDAARLRAATQVREPYHGISLYYFWPDGTKRVVVLGGTPFFDGRGEFLGYRGASRDVTAVVESRREIERRRVLLDAILENLTQGITAVDRDLGVVAVNHRARELLEFPEEVMREGARFEDIIRYNALRGEYGPGDPEMQVSSRVELARKFQPHDFERARPDGTVIEVRGRPLPGGGMVTTYSDITDRKRSETALRRAKEDAEAASRAKSAFLATMSHELRTPLNAVIGFAEMIAAELHGRLPQAEYRDYARDIVASARHLLDMINDILDLSRIEAGRYVIAPESVAARDAVGAAFRLVRTKAAAKRIDLVAELGEEAAVLWVDPRSIRQILLNLLSNAMKFSNAGGRITVTARRVAGHGVEIAVADTGFGMTPEEIPIALEPFGQVSSAHARSHEGTGLGLPIVKSLIDLHHGRLAIESEKGRGTTVRAVFPDPSSKKEDRAV